MVRVGTPSAVARPAWHDRNPSITILNYGGELAPHAITERFTYTVPAGRKALVEVMQAFVMRIAAATTPGAPYYRFQITPSGGSEVILLNAFLLSIENAAKDTLQAAIGATLTLFAGDRIRAMSGDGSTGGTVYYWASMKITEFDA